MYFIFIIIDLIKSTLTKNEQTQIIKCELKTATGLGKREKSEIPIRSWKAKKDNWQNREQIIETMEL